MRSLTMVTFGLLSVGLASLTAGVALAQHQVRLGQDLEFDFPDGTDSVSLPFRVVNNHVLIDVSVNGSKPLTVILDTGMPASALMLYDTKQVQSIGLEYGAIRAQVGGAGGSGERREASVATGVNLGFGELKVGGATAIVMDPLAHLSSYHDGVVGAILFQNFVVRVDYDEQRLQLFRPETFQAPKGAVEVPFELQGNMPFVEASVKVTPEKPAAPVRVVVDLGASHPVSLNATADGPIPSVPEPNLRTVLGRGVGGEVLGVVGRIAEFSIGGKTLKNVIATFPDPDHQNPRGMDSRNGNLGNGILQRFNPTFDYSRSRMLLEPGSHFGDPFEWDLSGLRFREEAGKLTVDAVLPGSPAEAAGIAVGDVVVQADGQPVGSDEGFELRSRLRESAGPIRFELERDGKRLEKTVKLARMV